jgi:HSP20 family protein
MLSPFRGFMDLQSEVDRMFDGVLSGLARSPERRRQTATEWSPAMDVLSRDGDLVIRAELPGVKKEDVDITLSGGVLTLSGRSGVEHKEQNGGYYLRERRYGAFRRSMALPEDVDESKIHASFEDGILEVTVEGAAAVQEPRRIEIEGQDGQES